MKKRSIYSVTLNSVGKEYFVELRRKPTLVSTLMNLENKEKFWALKNFSLKIKAGEKIGIIGRNGSGKTTLLKIISGITNPTKGKVKTYGKVVSLLDPNAGFHPDLNGYENIMLNGLLLGMDKKEIQNKLDTIINFAGIGKFINAPLYTYSSGMRLRLGFSVCMFSDADIFLFDETIYAGDQDFIFKVQEKLREIFSSKKITLLVATHVPELISNYCSKCIWIENGRLVKYGNFRKTVNDYHAGIGK